MAGRAAAERVALGADAVVPPSVAARWLPWGRAASLAWLNARGLIRVIPDVPGGPREVVIWGEVLDALRGITVAVPKRPSAKLAWSDPGR